MAILVTTDDVQKWLEKTKLTVTEVDEELSDDANAQVLGQLATRYDVTVWTAPDNTPKLVRSVISALLASWTYRRNYSEATGEAENSYATWLENRANLLMQGILTGVIDILEIANPSPTSEPAYWPTAETGMTQQYDAQGVTIGNQFGADRKFAMGMKF